MTNTTPKDPTTTSGVTITAETARRCLVGLTIEAVDVEYFAKGRRALNVHVVRHLRLSDGSRITLGAAELPSTRTGPHEIGDWAATMTRYPPAKGDGVSRAGSEKDEVTSG